MYAYIEVCIFKTFAERSANTYPLLYVSSLLSLYRDFDTASPLAGLGYGLPISRNYARYFDGELTVSACLCVLLFVYHKHILQHYYSYITNTLYIYTLRLYTCIACLHVYLYIPTRVYIHMYIDYEYGGVRHGQLYIPASTGRLALCRAAVTAH